MVNTMASFLLILDGLSMGSRISSSEQAVKIIFVNQRLPTFPTWTDKTSFWSEFSKVITLWDISVMISRSLTIIHTMSWKDLCKSSLCKNVKKWLLFTATPLSTFWFWWVRCLAKPNPSPQERRTLCRFGITIVGSIGLGTTPLTLTTRKCIGMLVVFSMLHARLSPPHTSQTQNLLFTKNRTNCWKSFHKQCHICSTTTVFQAQASMMWWINTKTWPSHKLQKYDSRSSRKCLKYNTQQTQPIQYSNVVSNLSAWCLKMLAVTSILKFSKLAPNVLGNILSSICEITNIFNQIVSTKWFVNVLVFPALATCIYMQILPLTP